MGSDVVHLKYTLEEDAEWFKRMSKDDRTSFMNQANHSTLCWMNSHSQALTMTTIINKVTCKKCLAKLRDH